MTFKQLSSVVLLFILQLSVFADTESNNSPASANPLSFGASMTGTVNHSDSEDYYEVTTTEYGSISVTMRMSGGHGDVWLTSAQDGFIKSTYVDANEGDMTKTCLAPGKYFIIAKSGGVGSSGIIDYNLTATFASSTQLSDAEPNFTLGTAISLNEGTIASGNLRYYHAEQYDQFSGFYENKDFYKIVTSKPGTLKVEATINSGDEGSFQLLRKDSTSRAGSNFWDEFGSGDITYTSTCLEQDTFYLFILKSNSGCGEYSFRYTIENGVTLDNDSANNNSFATATEIPTAVYGSGHLGFHEPSNDATDVTDYYKFYIDDDGDMFFELKLDSNFSHGNVDIFNANEKHLGNANGSGTLKFHRECTKEGWYYAKVTATGCGGYEYLTDLDSLSSFNKDPENNDSADSAKYVAQGQAREGHIGYKTGSISEEDDEDWFQLITDKIGNLSIPFEADSAVGRLTLTLYTYPYVSYQQSALVDQSGLFDTLKYNCATADTFLLEVTHNKSHCGGYTFKYDVEQLSYADDNEDNESFSSAIPLSESVASQGQLGFLKADGTTTDQADLYMITGVQGTHVNVILSNNGNLADSMTISILDNNGSTLVQVGDDGQFPNYQEATVCNFPSDTGYIDLTASECGSYSVRFLKDTTVILIDSLGPLCQDGSTHQLNATPTGGFWVGLGTSGFTNDFIVDQAEIGQNQLIYSVLTFNTCYSKDSTVVQVNALPEVDIIDPNDPWCDNDTVKTLLSTPIGGTWSGKGVLDSLNGLYDPGKGASGNNLITYEFTDSNGCTNSDTTTIHIFETPFVEILSGDTIICHPDSTPFFLAAEPLGGAWGGKGITGTFDGEYTPSLSHDIDFVTYTVATDDNCFETDTVLIQNLDGPFMNWSASPGPQNSVIVSTEFTGADTYVIDYGDGTIESIQPETVVQHDYGQSGEYQVCMTSSVDGCFKTECVTVIASVSGSAAQLSASSLVVYPNPSSGVIYIQNEDPADFVLSTLQGENITSGTLQEGVNQIKLGEIASGSYLLMVSNKEKGYQTSLIVIEQN